jgi:putative DNA primase/helicase
MTVFVARSSSGVVGRSRVALGRVNARTQVTNLAALRERLAERAERLVIELLGAPTTRGEHDWSWANHGGLSYDFRGHCWHCSETELAGDLIDLIQYGNPGWDLGQAIAWARTWIGYDDHARRGGRRPSAPLSPAAGLTRFKAAATRMGLRLWREAQPAKGSLVETYLSRRGLFLPERSEELLRFHPECPRGQDRVPAMLALVRGIVTDRAFGVYCTFLDAGGGKPAVESGRIMRGRSKGAVLKATRDEDVTMGLALTESIEDALAVLQSGWHPVWACLSAGAMAHFPVLGGIEELTIFAAREAPARAAGEACVTRWRDAGREAKVADLPVTQLNASHAGTAVNRGSQMRSWSLLP